MTRMTRDNESNVVIEERAQLRMALDDASHMLTFGKLPAYLKEALLRYHASQSKQRRDLLLSKQVKRYSSAGSPLSNAVRDETAFERAGKDLGVSAKTAQRAHRNIPADDEVD